MAKGQEDKFVQVAMNAAKKILGGTLSIERGASLLYQVTVNNRLEVTVDPRKPKRGQSAFQTDLCVFDEVDEGVRIPRVVMEFKHGVTTHDVLTYSTKAGKHKQIYPYLRYGIVSSKEPTIPGRFFTHNQWIDFFVAAASYNDEKSIEDVLRRILDSEIASSRRLEKIAYGKVEARVYREEIILEDEKKKLE